MAIVQTGVARNGVRFKIDDSCAAKPGTAEYERIAGEQCRIAHRILMQAAKREGKEKHEKA